MSCIQTLSGITKDCSSNMGGIVKVYMLNRDEVDTFTITDDLVTKITAKNPQNTRFSTFGFPRNTGNLTSTYNIDRTAGTRYVSSDLTLYFNRMETSKRVAITALAQAELLVIVKDANGRYWLLGYEEGASANGGGGETGTARADSNRYSIIIHDESSALPLEVNYSAFEDLLVEE